MNYSKYRFTLDIQSSVSQVSIPARRYDTGIKLLINLANGGSPYVITDGCRAVFAGKKADGKTILNDCIIENNKTIVYKFTQQTTSCEGIVNCEIRLYGKGGDMLTNPKFIIVVDERVFHDEEVPLSDHEKPILDNIIISEAERIEAETIRTEAEESRVEAENNRVEAESNREAAIEEFKTAVENGEFDGRGINWRGTYVPGTSYTRADAVYYNGSSYICKISNAVFAPDHPDFWDILAEKGGKGDDYTITPEDIEEIAKSVEGISSGVSSVNGKTGAVTLDAESVGARPSTWMPTPAEIGARPSSWTPNYSDVGADKSGTAASAVSTHNTNTESHNDIRLLISGLAERVNALLNSDDTTLDETREIVAYIKANKALIDSITTNKVNVADVINNLTSNVANKPLSAAQGVVIKALIDAKLDSSKLTESINTALAEAKASGEFDGSAGQRGTGILNTTTGIASYTTTVNGIKPTYRIALSTLKTQSKVDDVIVGDTVRYSTFVYPVIYVDADYAYLGARVSIQGTAGTTPKKGTDYFTPEDVAEIVSEVLSNFTDVSEVAI